MIFLHKIVEGGADRSYGVHVARLAGVPRDVIERACVLLPQLQAHLAKHGGQKPRPARARRPRLRRGRPDGAFTTPADRAAAELKASDLDAMTPMQAMDLLRKLRSEL